MALGAADGCETSPLFLSSSFASFETKLLIELELLSELLFDELLSGSAVSAVGVDDLSETSTISCIVANGALFGTKRPGSIPSSFRISDHIKWR